MQRTTVQTVIVANGTHHSLQLNSLHQIWAARWQTGHTRQTQLCYPPHPHDGQGEKTHVQMCICENAVMSERFIIKLSSSTQKILSWRAYKIYSRIVKVLICRCMCLHKCYMEVSHSQFKAILWINPSGYLCWSDDEITSAVNDKIGNLHVKTLKRGYRVPLRIWIC